MDLEALTKALKGQPDLPPLDRWNPPLSGDIDINIRADGSWYHEGDVIQRHSLVTLFASILRREQDGEYYLVTPVEKWRINVEDSPLIVVDFDIHHKDSPQQEVVIKTNVDRYYVLSDTYPLVTASSTDIPAQGRETSPQVRLDYGLTARFSRAAFYRLVDCAYEHNGTLEICSSGRCFAVGNV